MPSKSTYKPLFFAKDTFSFVYKNRWSWKYLIIPAIINFFLFFFVWSFLFVFTKTYISGLSFFASIPSFVSTITMGLIFLVTLMVSLLLFFLLANFIASPFNGLLAEKMLIKEGLLKVSTNSLLKTILIEIQRTIKFEIVKIFLTISIFVFGLILGIVPIAGFLLASIFNMTGNAYIALMDFFDPALSNVRMPVSDRFRYVRGHLKENWGLFFLTMFVMYIPMINIIYIPFAVVSSTLSFIEDQKHNSIS